MTLRLTIAAALTAGVALAAALPAAADTVTIQTRSPTSQPSFSSSADYVNAWNALLASQPTAPAGYGDFVIDDWNGSQNNQSLVPGGGSNSNLAFHDKAVFYVDSADAGQWAFRFGVDFGWGGTLLLDGQELQTKTGDLWWGGDYGNTSQLLAGAATLTAGKHTIDLYGFEGCCDGGTGGQFLKPGANAYADFTTNSNGPGAVPEPAAWALMITGFGAAGAMLRRRRAAAAVA